jgi:peptide/nickel transport system substrate-binding protein
MKMLSRWRYGLVAGLALVAAIALAACNPLQLKIATAQSAGIVSSLLSDPKTFNYALSNEYPECFHS